MNKTITNTLASLLVVFALLTLFMSSSVIFDLFGIREKEGNYVLFIVWANFICSILYLFSAYGLFRLKKWAFQSLAISLSILIIAFFGLLIYINSGGIYETKTIGAMMFRILITLGFTTFTYFNFRKKKI